MKTSLILLLLLCCAFSVLGATQHWSGGTYSGVAPNCTGTWINANSNTVWNNMRVNLSCPIRFSRLYALNNVSLQFTSNNLTDNGIMGINGTAAATHFIVDNNTHITSRGNNSYIRIPFDNYLHNNTNITIRNSSFANMGNKVGGDANRLEGMYISSCGNGSIIRDSTFKNGWQGLYIQQGNSGRRACAINITNNQFINIKYTTLELNGNPSNYTSQNSSYVGHNYFYGPGNASGITGYALFTSNTRNNIIAYNYFTNFNYYVIDVTQGDKNMTIKYNTIYNNKNPIVLNTNMSNISIHHNNISVAWGGAFGITTQTDDRDIYIKNNKIENTSNDCLALYADLHGTTVKHGTSYAYVYNNSCINSHVGCWNLRNTSNIFLIQNNCTNAKSYGAYITDKGQNVNIKRNYFAQIGTYSIRAQNLYGTDVNATICRNTFMDQNVSTMSDEIKWWCSTDGNFWGNNTVNHDCDAYADRDQVLNGTVAGQTDIYPLAVPYGRSLPSYCTTAKWSPEVLAVCDQMFSNMNILAIVLVVFVGIGAIGSLVAFGASPLGVVVAIISGIIVSTVGVVILSSIC